MGPSRQTTNLGVGSSNLSGRATSLENHSIILESENLPCRTEKSAWHLHGCVQVRCNLGIPLLLEQNRPFCFSRGLASPSSASPVAGNISTPPKDSALSRWRAAPPKIGLFCLMLRWSGGRISEVLALAPASNDIESGVASIEMLKRRIVRQVPSPLDLLDERTSSLDSRPHGAIPNWPANGFGVSAARRRGDV